MTTDAELADRIRTTLDEAQAYLSDARTARRIKDSETSYMIEELQYRRAAATLRGCAGDLDQLASRTQYDAERHFDRSECRDIDNCTGDPTLVHVDH